MSEIIKVKSGSKYEDLNSYSRLVVAGDMIFVSNTAGRNYKTRAIASDARGQAEQAFRNIEGALAAVDASLADVVAIRVFVPDIADMEAVGEVVGRKFRGIDPANTTTCTPLGQPELKVEFEVTAYRRRSDEAEKRISVDLS
ncbi:RidA family protein [Bosea sp. CS1GBMeth4]|uniref:RidA family protein n=1 Tax=Bosea sp. CS1GBMeth4 TaxID=1892849 RepID=UPI0016477816|nr:RidA family protein [Bosea sp. CS1GBMeth4]